MRLSNKRITGLNISNRKIKFAQVRYASGKWFVEKSAAKSVPADESGSPTLLIAKTIRELFDEYEVSARRLISSISGRDAVIKIIKLPTPKQAQKIDEIMDFELPRHIPLSIPETAYDYQALYADSQQTTVLLAATRREILEEHLKSLSLAGIKPVCVMPSSIMLANAAIAEMSGQGEIEKDELSEQRLSVFVNVTDTTADVVVLSGAILHHARSFVWQTLADSSRATDVPLAVNRGETVFHDKLLSELKSTLAPYQLDKITLLIEDDVDLEITQETVKSALPVAQCEIRKTDCELVSELAKGYVLPPPYLRLNLQKPILNERRLEQRVRTRRKFLKLAPVLAMLILMALSFVLLRRIDERGRELAHLRGERQFIKRRQAEVNELRQHNEKVISLSEELRWAELAYPAISYRLYQIAVSTPNTIWLKEISTPEAEISKKKLTRPVMSTLYVTGYAHSQVEIDKFVQSLRKHDCFAGIVQKNSEQVFKSGGTLLEFQLMLKSIEE